MECSNCGRLNLPAARFCQDCRSWLEGETAGQPGPALPARNVGLLLSETFEIYQRNFLPLLLMAFLPQVPLLLSVTVAGSTWPTIVLSVIGFVAWVLVGSAMVIAVAQHYTGREVDIGECLYRAWSRVLSLLVAYIPLFLALAVALALAFIIIGIPLFFYLLVSWIFAGPAIMIEGRPPIDALRRSHALVKGSWWRVFGIVVVFALVLFGLAIVVSIPAAILINLSQATLGNLLGVLANALVLPVAAVGATLVYLDLRVRKERYTLDEMASELGI